MSALEWTRDPHRLGCEVARLGAFEITIQDVGEMIVGVQSWVATFAGCTVSNQATREACISEALVAARRMCSDAALEAALQGAP